MTPPAGGESNTGCVLTTEAGVFALEELTQDQRAAAKRILERLNQVADAPDKRHPREREAGAGFLPRIDRRRRNTLLLIDGDRGTGKSSVLLTVLELLVERYCCATRPHALGPASASSRASQAEDGTRLPGPAQALIVPLGIVDLQALPDDTHVLLHLLRALDGVRAHFERSRTAPDAATAAWLRSCAPAEPPTSERSWTQLKKAAALGWPAPSQVGGRVDPETFIHERLDAEDSRLTLADAFARFVDALVLDLKNAFRLKDDPLLVLPIDDADMNPHLSVELLHLLRLLYHPRLWFLLTGCGPQFRDALAIDALARIWRPLERSALVPDESERQRAQRLAGQWYLKAVPDDNRAPLLTLSTRDRIERFRMMAGKVDLALKPLAPVPGVDKGSKATLYHYLEGLDVTGEALPDHLRGLVALAQRVCAAPSDGCRRAKEAVLGMWDDACQRASTPPHRISEALQGVRAGDELNLTVDGSGLRLTGQRAFWCPGRAPVKVPRPAPDLAVDVARGQAEQWRFQPDDLRLTFQMVTAPYLVAGDESLDARRSATLFLAAWITLDDAQDRTFGTDADYWDPYARVSLPTAGRVATLKLNWPLPRWQWPDALLFLQGWQQALRRLPYGEPQDPRLLAAIFLRLVMRVARQRDVRANWPGSGDEPEPAGAIAREVVKLRDKDRDWPDDERFETHRAWLRECALLFAAPESGLPEDWARDWVNTLRAEFNATPGGFAEAVEASRRERRARLTKALRETQTVGDFDVPVVRGQLLEALDTSFHSWEDLVSHDDA